MQQIIAELIVPAEKRVCGWLVCVEGINKGRAYQIHPGKNFIGSRDDMDIQIRGDRQISEIRHAVVIYDAKSQKTLLLPGEARGLVYLEDEAVYERRILEPYNNIEIGHAKLMFVPFCNSRFTWEENE